MNKVVVVNYGTKYPENFTHRIYNMVKRNTTQPFEFYVLTDNVDLYPDYKVIDISKEEEKGWWCKLLMFKPNILPEGKYLYLDLDVVIVDNIDCIFDWKPFGILRDFIRPNSGLMPGKEYNSSVMVFEPHKLANLYNYYIDNKKYFKLRQEEIHFFGDQCVISAYFNTHSKFLNVIPDEWCWSFKKGVERGKHAGDRSRMFGDEIPKDGKICVFHGVPNPTDVNIDWVKQHYQ